MRAPYRAAHFRIRFFPLFSMLILTAGIHVWFVTDSRFFWYKRDYYTPITIRRASHSYLWIYIMKSERARCIVYRRRGAHFKIPICSTNFQLLYYASVLRRVINEEFLDLESSSRWRIKNANLLTLRRLLFRRRYRVSCRMRAAKKGPWTAFA